MHPCKLLFYITCLFSTFHFSFSQSDSPRNIETFYPSSDSSPPPPTPTPTSNPNQETVVPPPPSKKSNKPVITAVMATAATTLALAGLIFFLHRRRRKTDADNGGSNSVNVLNRVGSIVRMPKFDGDLKGYIVDENGLDMVYWRKLEGVNYKNSYRKEVLNSPRNGDDDGKKAGVVQEVPLLRGLSSNSEAPLGRSVSSRRPITSGKSSVDGGSSKYSGDIIEAMFGSLATNRKSRENPSSSNPVNPNSIPPLQIFILDPRRSENMAAVLRSIAISRKEILDALISGHGLNADTLEKLTTVSPTKEEERLITAFKGDLTRLADAESFLYHLLKAVPLAFPRIETMFFRSNFVFEISHLKEYVQTLDLGCKELRTRGLFLKVLEAVLKTGNKVVVGASRSKAQGFNLTALKKLSDVRSTDGKSTLLHFVVEEVVRSEGKRCVHNRHSQYSAADDETEKEYIKLGLPIVGGLGFEFTMCKKAATIDYNWFAEKTSFLTTCLAEVKRVVSQCAKIRGGFVSEMSDFIVSAEGELKELRQEHTRVMELVKKTTDYFQAGGFKNKAAQNPLQLFVLVKDFVSMVDQVCDDIARNMQNRRIQPEIAAGSSSTSTMVRSSSNFPMLPANFLSESEISDDS